MKPGPPPKPRKLKLLEGNRGKRSLDLDEPQPELGAPSMPDDLSPYAAEAWADLVPKLDRMGLLTEVDGPALRVLCEAISQHRRAVERVNASDVLIEGARGDGAQVKHPAMQVIRDTAATIRSWSAAFGLTPSDRTRMAIPGGGGGVGDLRQELRREAAERCSSEALVPRPPSEPHRH